VCVLRLEVCFVLFFQVLSRIPPVFRGPSGLSPTISVTGLLKNPNLELVQFFPFLIVAHSVHMPY
jgi:hypothetical protein